MLSKAQRLTNNKDFQNIYRRGRYNATAFLSVNVLPNRSNVTKIGIVASKKAAKKAHDRNAVKRKVREIARLNYPLLKSGLSIVISIKHPAVGIDYKILEKDLLSSFKKLDLFKDEIPK